jgi:hypothetical protein
MTIDIETILSALCSQVEALPSQGFQRIYLLQDAKEAKIACDVLNAHGFAAKLYPENGASKMYVPQANNVPDIEKRLTAALAYAQALKPIKLGLDNLQQNAAAGSPDYSVSITTPTEFDKKISIQLSVPAPPASQLPPAVTPPSLKPPAARRPDAQKRQGAKAPEPGVFSAGPQIAKQSLWFKKREQRGNADSSWQQFSLYIKGNVAPAGMIVASVAITLLIIYSLFVVSKGWLCPDFVEAKKNTAWYCTRL